MYPHGLPFSKDLAPNIDHIVSRIANNKASLIIIDGGVGEGKTTLGVELCDYVQKKPTDFLRQYAMGGDQFQEKLEISYNLGLNVTIYDEAGDFSRRGALTSFNKRLNTVFDTYRAYKILVILILPCFNVLDEHLFDLKVPRMLLHCENRTSSQGNFSAYSLYRMHYVRHKMADRRLVIKDYAYSRVAPNFRGHFLNLEPARSIELDRISRSGKESILSEAVIESKGLVNIQTIQKKVHRSYNWIRLKLKELKVKPDKVYKKRQYFEEGVIDRLWDERRHQ
jgi:hypothetical protein